ncbi:MAG TPA: inositol 2-dehydrogenase [Steroidobacteraceae bacterium]|nr:inositol 2-dehydrogenase [Steroidobacteraceae bacterium]
MNKPTHDAARAAIALIGGGRIGKIHAANAAAHPALSLKYVIDPFGDAAAALASRHGATVTTLESALADPVIAGVIVASPTDQHLAHCLQAAAAGKAVFCEKPVDLSVERARSALTTLGKARLFLGFNRRFDPSFRALRQKLQAGVIGSLETLHIISHDPAPPPVSYIKVSGGLFKDMTIHDFDVARWLLAEPIVEVYAMAACLVDPAIGAADDIDTAKVLLRTASGRIALVSNTRRSGYGYDQRIEAFGSGGSVRVDNMTTTTVAVWDEEGASRAPFQNFFLERYAEAYRSEMDHFAAVLHGEEPAVGFADGVRALELAEAAARSHATGRPVALSGGA